MKFQLKKSVLGRYTTKYQCPKCKIGLSSALEEAGQPDNCPECSASFQVPGKEKLDEWNRHKELMALEAKKKEAAKQEELRVASEQAKEQAEKEALQKENERQILEAQMQEQKEAQEAQRKSKTTVGLKQSNAEQASRQRYPALHSYIRLLWILGVLTIVFGILGGSLAFMRGLGTENEILIGSAFLTIFSSLVTGGGMIILSELVRVFLDIESNTREKL
ncbi:hypothetical protein [Novipirellula galeiformis]|nr:hypothetical protein [Novipirellula galeiformis]